MTRALCYCRVSTKEQADSGYSLDAQVIETQKFARTMGFEIAEVINEDVSGSFPMDDRPKGRAIRGMILSHSIDVIVVYCVDRLSRDLVNMLIDCRFWFRSGIRLFFLEGGEVKSENDIIFIMKGWQGTEEKKTIVKRLSKGRRDKATNTERHKGQWVGCGAAPYGYRKIGRLKDARLEIDNDQAEVIRWIFNAYIGRNGSKMSLREIANQLDAEGIPAPGFGLTHRNRSRGWWTPTIQKFIKNTTFIGKPKFAGIVIDAPELAFIDEGIFVRANEQLQKNFKQFHGRRKFDYLLAGRLLCVCGRPMFGMTNIIKIYQYKYYRCAMNRQADHANCQAPVLDVDEVDNEIWGRIYKTINNEDELDQVLTRMEQRKESENERKKERLESVYVMLDRVSGKINKLIKAFGNETDDLISESMQNEIKQLGMQRQAILKNKEDLEADINRNSITPEMRREILGIAAKVRERLGDASFKNKKRLMEMLGIEVILIKEDNNRYRFDIIYRLSEEVLSTVNGFL